MADTPIKQQPGLTQEQIDSMKPVEQKYRESGDTNILSGMGIESQKAKISNDLHKILSEYFVRLQKMDSKDEYAKEKELMILSDHLTDFFCDLVSAQKVTIKTKATTTDTLIGTATNVQSGATSPMTVMGNGDGNGTSTAVVIS